MSNPFKDTPYEEMMKDALEKYEREKELEKFKNCMPEHHKPTGMPGWICPRCGAGHSPFVNTCPCVPIPARPITFGCNTNQVTGGF